MNANERIQWLHKRICDGRYPNAMRLSERFGISHRQAQRDVEALREDFGAPLLYDRSRGGYYYKEEFRLPTYTVCANEEDFVESVTGNREKSAREEIVQMQIPYSCTVRIPDKLTQLELRRFISGRAKGKDCFLCEFHSIEMFIGVLFSTESEVEVVSPPWLREKIQKAADRVLSAHRDCPDE